MNLFYISVRCPEYYCFLLAPASAIFFSLDIYTFIYHFSFPSFFFFPDTPPEHPAEYGHEFMREQKHAP